MGKKYNNLKIVPFTIDQYKDIFYKIMSSDIKIKNLELKNVMDECLINRKNLEPDVWLNQIEKVVSNYIR